MIISLAVLMLETTDGLLDDAFHVAPLGANDPPCDLELLLVLDLDIVAAGKLVLFGGVVVLLSVVVQLLAFVRVERLPVDGAEIGVNLVGQFTGVFVVPHPARLQLETVASQQHSVEELKGDVGVEEGVVENVGLLAVPAEHHLVELPETQESVGEIAVVQFRLAE